MKKYNQCVTVLEVLISIIIIGFVILFLFTMLNQIRNEDNQNNIQSTFVITQSSVIKQVSDDIIDFGVSAIESCSLDKVVLNTDRLAGTPYRCVKIKYSKPGIKDNIGFILIYQHFLSYSVVNKKYQGNKDDTAWTIHYVRGHYTKGEFANTWTSTQKATLRDLVEPIVMNDELAPVVTYTRINNSKVLSAGNIQIPIETMTGERYDINIGFNYNQTTNPFKCVGSSNSVNRLTCTEIQ